MPANPATTTPTRNARFWAFVNGCHVKITLRPGQTLGHATGGPNEEGWSSEFVEWTHEGDHLRRESGSDGADCDGRFSTGGVDVCDLDHIASYTTPRGVKVPNWRDADRWQRDYSAEAAGY